MIEEMTKSFTEMVLVHDPDLCTGCMLCMIACAYKHHHTYDFNLAYIGLVESPKKPGSFIGCLCSHCEYPVCQAACPTEAIRKDELGVVLISATKCIACGNCILACPISMPKFDERMRVVVNCDLCDGDPVCVKLCPTQALRTLPREKARKWREGST